MSRPRIISHYQSLANNQWYWHVTAGGNIVEVSGEGYTTEQGVLRSMDAKLKATYRRRQKPTKLKNPTSH